MRKTTVSALAGRLPVGAVLPSGERCRTYAFKPWRTSDELELGKLRDKNRAMPVGEFASHVLAHFLTEWCGQPVAGLQPHERRLIVSRAWAGDFYAAWFALRQLALGNDLDMRIVCSLCRTGFDYTVDLGSIEAEEVEDGEELRQAFALRDGFEFRGSPRRVLTLEPLRWATYESLGEDGLNTGALKTSLIAGSVVGVDGIDGDVKLSSAQLDLTKYDLESLTARINKRQPGPSLAIETGCPKCNAPITRSLSWVYDSFFSARDSGPGGASTP